MTGFRPKNSLRARMRSARNARAYTGGELAELGGFGAFAVIDRCLIDRSKIDRREWLALRIFSENFLAKNFFMALNFAGCKFRLANFCWFCLPK